MKDSKVGWYEIQDVNGVWHKITPMQAAAYKADGAPVRYQTEAMKVRQAVTEAIKNEY